MTSVSDEIPLCDDCVQRLGLCARHRREILPKLAQVAWHRLINTPHQKTAYELLSPAAKRIVNRKRTKAASRARMAAARGRSLSRLSA